MQNKPAMVYGKRINGVNCLVHSENGIVNPLVKVAERFEIYKSLRDIGIPADFAIFGTHVMEAFRKRLDCEVLPVGK